MYRIKCQGVCLEVMRKLQKLRYKTFSFSDLKDEGWVEFWLWSLTQVVV